MQHAAANRLRFESSVEGPNVSLEGAARRMQAALRGRNGRQTAASVKLLGHEGARSRARARGRAAPEVRAFERRDTHAWLERELSDVLHEALLSVGTKQRLLSRSHPLSPLPPAMPPSLLRNGSSNSGAAASSAAGLGLGRRVENWALRELLADAVGAAAKRREMAATVPGGGMSEERRHSLEALRQQQEEADAAAAAAVVAEAGGEGGGGAMEQQRRRQQQRELDAGQTTMYLRALYPLVGRACYSLAAEPARPLPAQIARRLEEALRGDD